MTCRFYQTGLGTPGGFQSSLVTSQIMISRLSGGIFFFFLGGEESNIAPNIPIEVGVRSFYYSLGHFVAKFSMSLNILWEGKWYFWKVGTHLHSQTRQKA